MAAQLEHGRAAPGRPPMSFGVWISTKSCARRLRGKARTRALHAEDGLVGGRAKIDHAVVQPRVLTDAHVRGVLGLERRLGSRRVLELERKHRNRSRHAVNRLRDELHGSLRARRHGLRGLGHETGDVHDGFLGEVGDPLDHALGHVDVVDEEHHLDGRVCWRSTKNAGFALPADGVQPRPRRVTV